MNTIDNNKLQKLVEVLEDCINWPFSKLKDMCLTRDDVVQEHPELGENCISRVSVLDDGEDDEGQYFLNIDISLYDTGNNGSPKYNAGFLLREQTDIDEVFIKIINQK